MSSKSPRLKPFAWLFPTRTLRERTPSLLSRRATVFRNLAVAAIFCSQTSYEIAVLHFVAADRGEDSRISRSRSELSSGERRESRATVELWRAALECKLQNSECKMEEQSETAEEEEFNRSRRKPRENLPRISGFTNGNDFSQEVAELAEVAILTAK